MKGRSTNLSVCRNVTHYVDYRNRCIRSRDGDRFPCRGHYLHTDEASGIFLQPGKTCFSYVDNVSVDIILQTYVRINKAKYYYPTKE